MNENNKEVDAPGCAGLAIKDVALPPLPLLPAPHGVIAIYADDEEGNQTHEVDGFTADQMRGYAMDARAALAQAASASPASAPVASHGQLLADLYEFTKYAACSQRHNTGDFLDGLFAQIEKLQPQCAAALAAPLPPVVARKDGSV